MLRWTPTLPGMLSFTAHSAVAAALGHGFESQSTSSRLQEQGEGDRTSASETDSSTLPLRLMSWDLCGDLQILVSIARGRLGWDEGFPGPVLVKDVGCFATLTCGMSYC